MRSWRVPRLCPLDMTICPLCRSHHPPASFFNLSQLQFTTIAGKTKKQQEIPFIHDKNHHKRLRCLFLPDLHHHNKLESQGPSHEHRFSLWESPPPVLDDFGQLSSLRLLTKAFLSTRAKSNVEIIKPVCKCTCALLIATLELVSEIYSPSTETSNSFPLCRGDF